MAIEITNVLNDFLKTQGYAEDEICAEYRADEDSYYDESTSVPLIVLGGLTNKKADDHNTIDFLDDEEMEASEWTKFMLNIKETIEDSFTEKDYMSYFTCPIEMEATIDAVEFCNHCPEAAKKLDAAIQEAL